MERQLSPNFSLRELTHSETANKHGIVNNPSKEYVKNLEHLCLKVLQPLRDFYGKPIRVTSGYRCKTLNRIVGGSPSSQHMRGEAADLHIPSIPIVISWMQFIVQNCPFDQLLFEHNRRNGAVWLHVSCCADESRNRKQVRSLHLNK